MTSRPMTRSAWVLGVLAAGFLLVGCADDGLNGAPGAPGLSTATLRGVVTNGLSGAPLPGAVVTTDPVIPGVQIVADGTGAFDTTLPIGSYDLTCADPGFVPGTDRVNLAAGATIALTFNLMPEVPFGLSIAGAPASPAPGSGFTLTANVVPMDGSVVTGYHWTQSHSVQANMTDTDEATVSITLGNEDAYRNELATHLHKLERWGVQGIHPWALEEAALVAFEVEVTTTKGTYTAEVEVHTHLEFATVSPGLRNVPIDLPVLMSHREQNNYSWSLTTKPVGSNAVLDDPAIDMPSFKPDLTGRYVVSVWDIEDQTTVDIEIFAARWVGAITGQDGNGRPESSTCMVCHDDNVAPDKFTAWKETGHAEIFTDNLNTSTHYGESCFACHIVGWNKDGTNGGGDEASDYQAFLGSGLLNNPGDNWTTVLAAYPSTAQLANIQCESCHGPNGSGGGHAKGEPRIDLSSNVCATCHGEPKRHARFQQWELSGHANYELARDEGMSGSCSRCHTANGFVKWVPRLLDNDPTNDAASVTVDWTPDQIHSQTCVACHDPHDMGTTTGEGTNAKVRIQGDTANLEAGFKAVAVGKGALCMQCHNARRGLRNDAVWDNISDRDRYPHGRPNADLLMGQNMYWVSVGTRSPHSLITDTCVKCHMSLTDPPPELSYNLGGTNHTFEASTEICASCHGTFTADTVQAATKAALDELKPLLEDALYKEIEYQLGLGYTVMVEGSDEAEENDLSAEITDIDQVTAIHIETSHGRQAMSITVSGVEIHHVRLGGDTDILDIVPIGENLLTSERGSVIARAGWNYWLVDHDGSHGVHNPTFVIDGLNRAIERVKALDFTLPE